MVKSVICAAKFVSGNNLPAISGLVTSRKACSFGAGVVTEGVHFEFCEGILSIVSPVKPSVIALTSSRISGLSS